MSAHAPGMIDGPAKDVVPIVAAGLDEGHIAKGG
jgi:hypothetical protein